MSKHVTQFFVDWSEGRMRPAEQSKVEAHLLSCLECKTYFDKMSAALDVVDHTALPTLTPDPYLPTRIKALAESPRDAHSAVLRPGWLMRLRWAFSTAMVVSALSIGVFLGKGLATMNTGSTYEESFTSTDYQIIWDNSLADSWEDILQPNGEDNQ